MKWEIADLQTELARLLRTDPDAEIRQFAARALGEIGDVKATDALTEALEDANPEVRRQAAMALGELDYGNDDNYNDNYSANGDWRDATGYVSRGVSNDWDAAGWDATGWDNAEWDASQLAEYPADEGWEAFGESMSEIGMAAGRIGVEAGAFSLGIAAEVLSGMADGFGDAELEAELAAAAEEIYESELDLEELRRELEMAGLEAGMTYTHKEPLELLVRKLEAENGTYWENRDQLIELLDAMSALEDEDRGPGFCEKLIAYLKQKNTKEAREALNKISCREE